MRPNSPDIMVVQGTDGQTELRSQAASCILSSTLAAHVHVVL